MKDIRIDELVLVNFKCHSHLHLRFFGEDAAVYGDNGTGKTSIYDALTWLFYGRDSLGNGEKAIEVKPLTPSGAVRDPLGVTSVEAILLVDGKPRAFRRTYREVWNGRKEFQGHTSEYYIDSIPLRKQEFARRVAELVSEEQFFLLSSVHCFARELPWQQRRELLCRVAGVREDRDLMERFPQFSPLKAAMEDRDTEAFRSHLQGKLRELTQASSDIPARISECERTLREVEGLDFDAARQRWEELNRRREYLTARLFDPEEARLDSAQERKDSLLAELRRYREALKQLQTQLEHTRGRVFSGGSCPACGQALPAKRLAAVKLGFEEEKGRELRQLEERKAHLTREMGRAEEALKLLEEELSRAALPREGAGAAVRRELGILREQLHEQRSILDREALLTYSRDRLRELRRQEQTAREQLEKLRSLLEMLEEFGRFKAKFLEDSVNSRFRLARFRLFREKIGGGLEERCDVTLEGIPYINVNNGGKVRVGMDIIHTLSRAWGLRLPLFIDNAEGVTRLEDMDCQRICLAVAPGPLRVEGCLEKGENK